MKRGQLMAFCMGDGPKMLEIARTVEPVCKRKEYYHGMLSFALEQAGHPQEAEVEARIGVEVKPDDAWSHHAIAHALYFQGKLDDGLKWYEYYPRAFACTFAHTFIVWNDCLPIGKTACRSCIHTTTFTSLCFIWIKAT